MRERLVKIWLALRTPSTRYAAGTLIVLGALGGVIFWGGFNTALDYTNRLEFCISCHEMRDTVYVEYKDSIHYRNTAGVRAICSDCHVPHAWGPKMVRKIQATFRELPRKVLGTIGTKEKFEAHRLKLAQDVWAVMKSTDSRECRNCHSFTAMMLATQKPRARAQHQDALRTGETCIDCHKGIAHLKPKMPGEEKPPEDFSL